MFVFSITISPFHHVNKRSFVGIQSFVLCFIPSLKV
jgi:hypothetical protein